MSKGNDNFQPRGIYNRLITFVVDHLIVQGEKKVTQSGAVALPAHESIEVPIIGSSRNVKIMPSNASIGGINGVPDNEVVIDFRHFEEEEAAQISTSTSFRKLSSQINFPNYNNCFILRAADRIPVVEQGKETGRGRGGGGRPQNSADLSKKEESEDHSREKYIAEAATARTTISGNESEVSEDAIRKHFSRSRASRPPLKSVASNINEKADAFIRSRKEAMKRNFGHGS